MNLNDAPVGGSVNSREAPPAALLLLTAILVLVFTPLAVSTWRQAILDWQTVASDGVVVDIRFVKYARPLPKAAGPWHVVWEVACGEDKAERVSVTAPGSYQRGIDAQEASRSDLGRRATVWYVPGSDGEGSLRPPDWKRSVFAAVWTTGMAVFGWLGVVGCGLLALRKLGRRSAPAVPNAAPDPRGTP